MNANGIDLSSIVQKKEETQTASDGVVFNLDDASFEKAMELSMRVPVVIDLWAEWCQPCKTLGPILESVTRSYSGRIVLTKVDVDANPGLANAFKAQSIPTVVALVKGQPVPLFQGALPEEEVRKFYEQLLALAEQHGVTGTVGETEEDAPVEDPVDPAHETALTALENGDYETSITEYEKVLRQNPKDAVASAQLARVKLLHRLTGLEISKIRDEAAANPENLDAQLTVADLDISGGHIEDGFLRLLDFFEAADQDSRDRIRERLLEYFEVVGASDERVIAARGRLTNLLF